MRPPGALRRQRHLGEHRRVPRPSPRSTAPSSAARRSSPTRWPGSSPAPASPPGRGGRRPAPRDGARPPRRPAVPSAADRPRRPRRLRDRAATRRADADRRRADAGLARAPRALAARRPRRVGGGRRAAAGPDGQLRGRSPQPRRRAARAPGPAADRRRDRRRLVLRAARASSRPATRARPRRPAPPRQPHRAGRRPRQRPAPRRPRRARRGSAACRRCASTPCSTGATRRRARRSASSPTSSARLAQAHPDARIATVGGRYYAMDRDQRWERTKRGYDAIVHGVGERAPSARRGDRGRLRAGRERRVRRADGHRRASTARVRDGDPIVHANFRADRARQLTHALADAGLRGFDRVDRWPRPARPARRHDDRVRGRPAGPRRVPARGGPLARPGRLGRRLAPVPRRRDGEVRPRHVLLQRRPRGAAGRARTGCWCRARRSRPTTCSPR